MMQPPGLRPSSKSQPQATRVSNRRLLLQQVFDEGPISRADLARRTELGRATVSAIIADLIGEGLIVEVGQGESTGGKPPTLLELDPNGRFAVAVDLSPRPIKAALLNLRGRIVATVEGKTLAPHRRAGLEEVHRLIAHLISAASAPALGIGIGVPGAVDDEGRVLVSEQLEWRDLALREQVEEVYGFPTHVAADAEVAAVAEFGRTGSGPESTMVYVKVDDRVAIAVIAAGRLQRTPRHGGDFTHLRVPGAEKLCRCGGSGCLGTQVAVAELLGPEYQDMSTEARARLATESPPILGDAGHLLGEAVAPLVAALEVDHVVVGGQLAAWPAVAGGVGKGIEQALGWQPNVTTSRLGPSAVVLGAAGMVLSNELGVVWG